MTPLPTLAALLASVERRNDLTATRAAGVATRAGYKLTSSDISAYRTLGMKHVNPDKVLGLARGYGIPAYRIVEAIFTDFGVQFPRDVRTPEEAVEHDDTLSSNTRESLLLLIARDRGQAS